MAAKGSSLTNRLQMTASLCALLALTACLSSVSWAQDKQQQPLPSAPPPMKFIPRDEQARLSGARNDGERTRASIEFAEAHMRRAQELTSTGQYDEAAAELGNYQALFEDALKYLGEMDPNRGRVRDLYKRLELALREHAPRIETIRRTTPAEYAVHVKAILEFNKHARAKALDSFYGTTVMREQSNSTSSKSYDDRNETPASHPSGSPDKQP